MKIRNILTFAACVSLIGSPLTISLAEDSTPAPTKAAVAKPSVDPEKAKWDAARKKANEDPDVKAAMDAAHTAQEAAHTAQVDANKKMLDKVLEIDPTLAPMVEKEEEKLKPHPTMAPRPKPDPKPKASPKAKKAASPAASPATSPG